MRPVLEYGAVSAVSNQLVWMLRYGGVKIILDHQHNAGCLQGFVRIVLDWASVHIILRAEPIHIDTAVCAQFFGKLGSERRVELLGEVAQSIAQR